MSRGLNMSLREELFSRNNETRIPSMDRPEGQFDVVLRVEGKQINANRTVLASKSPVFKAMFKPHTSESINGIVDVKCTDYDVVQSMVRFICGENLEPERFSLKLLAAAEAYDVQGLKTICEERAGDRLTPNNAVQTLVEANLHDARSLLAASVDFIVVNLQEVRETKQWEGLQKFPSLLLKILDRVSHYVLFKPIETF